MLAACAACTFHAPTYAGDSWTGNDKREHFAYGAMTAVVVQAVVPNPWAAAALASAPGLLRALSGGTGTPIPMITAARLALKHVKDVKLRRRIGDALDNAQRRQAPGKRNPPVSAPGAVPPGDTLH